ncbi:16S rRNA (cytosine(1402)-N(4))-methyltransferase RsmH [soil metagenome]
MSLASPSPAPHLPVMLDECLEGLALQENHWYIDATFGAGGHTRALLQRGVCVLALDQDPKTTVYLDALREELLPQTMNNLRNHYGNFRFLDVYAAEAGVAPVAGVLFDLGVSSMQLDEGERGFAFRQDGPLDMRMSEAGESAADVVNTRSQEDLAALIYKYGEERHSRRLARAIVETRDKQPIATTQDLVTVLQDAYPGGYRREHPARRTFQALRIYVNDELGALEDALAAAERTLEAGGRLVVLSYHSLEDRIVKHFIKGSSTLSALTKRPLTATEAEIERNLRSRSAKLRVAEKVVAA